MTSCDVMWSGPGYYHSEEVAKPKTAESAAAPAFGSSQQRTLTTAPPQLIANPGPGTYKRVDYFKAKPVTDGLEPAAAGARIAFHATADRFSPPKAGAAPGPGFYSVASDVSHDLQKRQFGRNESFGATSVRFFDAKQSDPSYIAGASSSLAVPGPGSYNSSLVVPNDIGRYKEKRRPMANFASAAPRFNPKSQTVGGSGLAPGQYDPVIASAVNSDSAAKARPSPAFLVPATGQAGAARDPIPARQSLETAHLGPGRYSPSHPAHKPTKTVSSSFKDTKPRFRADNGIYVNRGNAGLVGPGFYSPPNDQSNSLIKRSFNITIAS